MLQNGTEPNRARNLMSQFNARFDVTVVRPARQAVSQGYPRLPRLGACHSFRVVVSKPEHWRGVRVSPGGRFPQFECAEMKLLCGFRRRRQRDERKRRIRKL